jgi:hypothetical protein
MWQIPRNWSRALAGVICAASVFCFPAASRADFTLTFDVQNNTFSFGGQQPGAEGYLTATFKDVTGGVELDLSSNLKAGEWLDAGKAWYFNFNPSKDSILSHLTFTLQSNTNLSQAASVSLTDEGFKADGTGGFFDILFKYSGGSKPFQNGEQQTYKITTSSGSITAADFYYKSSSDSSTDDEKGYLGAVHVQNTGPNQNGSAFVSGTDSVAPEPSSVVLFGIGGVGLTGLMARRRRRQAAAA